MERELRTVQAMVGMHCRGTHAIRTGLCADCEDLWAYVQQRVERCPFRDDKPTCQNCTVHCYKADRREQIRAEI